MKHNFRFIFLFGCLWAIIIIKAVIAPIDITFIQTICDGIRIQEPVSVELQNIVTKHPDKIRVYKINQVGNPDRVWRERGDQYVFKDSSHLWYGFQIYIPSDVSSIETEIIVRIGKDTVDLALINKVNGENRTFYEYNEKKDTNSILFPNSINYRGDLYLFLSTFLLSIIYYFVIMMIIRRYNFWLSEHDFIYLTLIFLAQIVLKFYIPFLVDSSVVSIFLDLLIIVTALVIIKNSKLVGRNETQNDDRNHLRIGTLITLVVLFFFVSFFYLLLREATLDEGSYFIRGYWYVSGILDPYSKYDGNWYPPLFYFLTGAWQKLLYNLVDRNSLFLIRILPLIINVLNMLIIWKILSDVTEQTVWCAVALFLYSVAPFGALMYNYSHPIVVVNLILLCIFYLYLKSDNIPYAIYLALFVTQYCLLIFIRRNTILIIPWLFAAQILFARHKRFNLLLTPPLVIFFVVAILSLSPERLSHVMIDLPYIKDLVYNLGLLRRSGIPGPVAAINASVPNWEVKQTSLLLDIIRRLWSKWNRYFLMYSVMGLFPVICFRFDPNINKKQLIGFAASIIFVLSSLLHALGAYSASNVFSYVHYTFSIGIIAITLGIKQAAEQFKSEKTRRYFIFILLATHVLLFFPKSIYRNYVSPWEARHNDSINKFSKVLMDYRIHDSKVLIVDTRRYIAQMAIHFAGGVPEPATLNLPFSHKESTLEVRQVIDLDKYNQRNWWTNEIMQDWIEREKHIAILYNDDKYAPVWKPEMEKYYNNKELFYFPYIGWYTIYSR